MDDYLLINFIPGTTKLINYILVRSVYIKFGLSANIYSHFEPVNRWFSLKMISTTAVMCFELTCGGFPFVGHSSSTLAVIHVRISCFWVGCLETNDNM